MHVIVNDHIVNDNDISSNDIMSFSLKKKPSTLKTEFHLKEISVE